MKFSYPELIMLMGIVLFIFGLFDLHEWKFGWYSWEGIIGMSYLAIGYFMRKFESIIERLDKMNDKLNENLRWKHLKKSPRVHNK